MTKRIQHTLILGFLLACSSWVQGQIKHSNYKIAYDRGGLNATNFAFEHKNMGAGQGFVSTPYQDISMPTSGVRLEAQTIQSFMYVSGGVRARFVHTDKTDERITGKFGELIWMKGSVGGSIDDVVGIFFGGQFKQSGFRGEAETDRPSDLRTLSSTGGGPGQEGRYQRNFFGKNERGVNANVVLNLLDNQILLRTEYQYNWLKMNGIPGNKGYQFFQFRGRNHILGAEAILYFSSEEYEDYGISIGFEYQTGYMDSGYQEGFEKEDFIPSTEFKQFQFSIGFLFAARGID